MVEDAKLTELAEADQRRNGEGTVINEGQYWAPDAGSNNTGYGAAHSLPRHLARGRYVNQEAGNVYRARSNSDHVMLQQKRDLTSSYDGHSRNAKLQENSFGKGRREGGRKEGGWKEGGWKGSGSTTNVTSAVMFSASLGSRDRFGSVEDEAEEVL